MLLIDSICYITSVAECTHNMYNHYLTISVAIFTSIDPQILGSTTVFMSMIITAGSGLPEVVS